MKTLFIDGNSILNRAYFAMPPLNGDDGRNVNAVYGFCNILLKALKTQNPDRLVVAFDLRGHNFRKDIYADYKANRKGMPDDLAEQMPVLHKLLHAMQVTVVEKEGVEADDIIGTLAKTCGGESVIVTGDRDLLQLIDDNVSVLITKKGVSEVEKTDKDNIVELFGLSADQIVDYKALRGDTSDNIPGVRGIGEKTATELLRQYGSLDGVYAHLNDIKGALKDKLELGRNDAEMSKKLATIRLDADVACDFSACGLPVFDTAVREMMTSLRFSSIVSRLNFTDGEQQTESEKPAVEVEEITTKERLTSVVAEMCSAPCAAYFFDGDVHLSCDVNKEYVVKIARDMLSELKEEDVFEGVKPFLEGKTQKVTYDSKAERHRLADFGADLKNVAFDVSLMQYLTEYRNFKNMSEMMTQKGFSSPAAALFYLKDVEKKRLDDMQMASLYNDVELPLSDLLYRMETEGVAVDQDTLDALSVTFAKEIDTLAEQIYALAGERFNIGSTKQLGVILFEKMMLPHGKKTKTGYSTDNEVLMLLKGVSDIADLLIRYRALTKLRSTYVEGIRPLVKHGVVHTTFNQSLTTTGRLSSSDPNLQNIPIRTELGREIRRLFVSRNGIFVGADYSQIELRLVAAFSGDKNLLASFAAGEDIHARVAAELMGIPVEMVTKNMRRTAKAVNFGIIYGISDYGLSQNTGLSVKKAHDYIKQYFEKFPSVKTYMDDNVAFAKQNGYVKTVLNRRRYIPELASSNFNLRSFGERAAMNMPLQGSAADIMKIAMLNVDKALRGQNLKSKIVLQIHDELIVDCYPDEVEQVKRVLKNEMENAVKLACRLSVELEEGKTLYEA